MCVTPLKLEQKGRYWPWKQVVALSQKQYDRPVLHLVSSVNINATLPPIHAFIKTLLNQMLDDK